jgi:hypothetical protein
MHEDAGMMGQFVVMPDASNSIEEEDQIDIWGVYPNPFNDLLTLKLPSDTKVLKLEVFDASGRVVFVSSNLNTSQLDLSILPQGVYSVKISTSMFTSTKRIIKQ